MSSRRIQHFTCDKCGTVNPDFLTFGVGHGRGARHYCLTHIPRMVRIRMWLREFRDAHLRSNR